MYKTTKISPVFTDERGTISDILETTINHIGLITSKKGSIRGKHYHKKSTQYIFVISGKLESFTKDMNVENSKVESHILVPGDLETVSPMLAHAHKALEDSVFLNFTTESRKESGYEDDTIRVEMNLE